MLCLHVFDMLSPMEPAHVRARGIPCKLAGICTTNTSYLADHYKQRDVIDIARGHVRWALFGEVGHDLHRWHLLLGACGVTGGYEGVADIVG